jgi:hypothetical protein
MSTSWRGREDAERNAESNGEQPEQFEDMYFDDVAADDFDIGSEDEGYTPPAPPPLPLVAPVTMLGALAVALGVGLLFYPGPLMSFLGISTTLALFLAAVLFAVGGATLISRLRNPDPEEPDDPEAGAQV